MITIIIDPKTDRTVIYLALCIMYHYFSGILTRSILKHANQNNFDHHRKGAKWQEKNEARKTSTKQMNNMVVVTSQKKSKALKYYYHEE